MIFVTHNGDVSPQSYETVDKFRNEAVVSMMYSLCPVELTAA